MDCQRELSIARAALHQVQQAHKPVVAILITESHTDKLAGIGLFAAAYPGVPIYASQSTIDTILHDGKGYIRLTQKLLGPEYPARVTPPNRVIHSDETLHLAGLTIQTRQLGPGEAPSHTLYYLPASHALFSGDLILHDMTPFFLEEYSKPWLRRLSELGSAFPQAQTLYPGHGIPGSPQQLIAAEARYITRFRQLVAAQIAAGQWDGKTMSSQGKEAVVSGIKAQYPAYIRASGIPNDIETNVDPIADELIKEEAVKPGQPASAREMK